MGDTTATKLFQDATAEMNDSHVFLILGRGEGGKIKLMYSFLSILSFSFQNIPITFGFYSCLTAQKSRDRDGALLSTSYKAGSGLGTHRHWSHLMLRSALQILLILPMGELRGGGKGKMVWKTMLM